MRYLICIALLPNIFYKALKRVFTLITKLYKMSLVLSILYKERSPHSAYKEFIKNSRDTLLSLF